jgi:hypothetical protein
MKKRTKVILGIVIGVLVLYSALMTFTVYIAAQDFNELETKYNDVNTKYVEATAENFSGKSKLIPLEAFAKIIDENADVSFSSDECAIIRLNMGEKTIETILAETTEHATDLAFGVKYAEVKTCIMCIVNKAGNVECGMTFHSDGTAPTSFYGEKYMQ